MKPKEIKVPEWIEKMQEIMKGIDKKSQTSNIFVKTFL